MVRDQLQREGIELVSGTARFLPGAEGEPHRVMVLRTREKTEAKTRWVEPSRAESSLECLLVGERASQPCEVGPVSSSFGRPGLLFRKCLRLRGDGGCWKFVRSEGSQEAAIPRPFRDRSRRVRSCTWWRWW